MKIIRLGSINVDQATRRLAGTALKKMTPGELEKDIAARPSPQPIASTMPKPDSSGMNFQKRGFMQLLPRPL